jgi:ribokinase
MQYDFIGIGDTVTDAFIKLNEATINYKNGSKEDAEICMRFADKIPYEDVWVVPAVGNAANAANSAARLGLKSAMVTNIGADAQGKEALAAFEAEKVGTEFIKSHEGIKTNYHYVLWYEDDRTILIKHEKYPYALPDVGAPKWIYFSSVSEAAFPSFHYSLADHLEAHPEIKFAFSPGKWEIKLGSEKLARLYTRADVFFCNKEEAEKILGKPDGSDIKELLQGIRALGPKIVVITDGPRGAYAYDTENKFWQMPIYPDPKPPYERTGAGDAFSSTFAVALAKGLPVSEALRWAPVNSMSVVQDVGARAGLLSEYKLKEWLAKAPADYQPKEI